MWGLVIAVAVGIRPLLHFLLDHPAPIRAEDIARGLEAPRYDGTHPCVAAQMVDGRLTTSLGRCAMPTDLHGGVDRMEADLRYGAFVLRQTDLEVDDGLSAPLTRAYNSADWMGVNRMHAFGRNANHSYDAAPLGTSNPYTEMDLVLADGDMLHFKRVSPGTSYSDAVYLHTETSTRFYKATMAWNGDGWTVRLADGATMVFPDSYGAKNLAQGAATQWTDAAGNTLTLKRDGDRNLERIVTPHGRWIRLEHDGQGCVTRADDDRGQWTRYAYDGDGQLVSVVSWTGAERHYTYQGRLMTEVRDGHGQLLVKNSYKGQALVQQEFGNGDLYRYRYDWNRGGTFAENAWVTLPGGSEHEVATGANVPSAVLRQ